ncbi:MAG TPA: Rid family hydrolase, partial [Solirubrobacteraceae bacterium]|nr:Rid family hydrolase [Solirubrobacteraceae bacterium]
MALDREAIAAPGAPAAIGPYSHAVRCGSLLFCSGQIPLDPATGEIVGTSAAEQARRCLVNLTAVC